MVTPQKSTGAIRPFSKSTGAIAPVAPALTTAVNHVQRSTNQTTPKPFSEVKWPFQMGLTEDKLLPRP